jgi:hypothetical protein
VEPEPVGDPGTWLATTLKAYAALADLPVDTATPLPGETFESARARLHRAAERSLPGDIGLDECRLESAGVRVEGEVLPEGLLGRFHPFKDGDMLPAPGTAVRLRHGSGVIDALVLSREGDAVLLCRAPTQRERRKTVRVPVEGVALLRLPLGEEAGSLFDLSVGGAGFTAPYAIEVGQSVHLVLRIDGKRSLPLECDAVVTSCRKMIQDPAGKHRVGVRFEHLPDALIAEIQRAVRPVD